MLNTDGQFDISVVCIFLIDFLCLHEGDASYHFPLDDLDTSAFWLLYYGTHIVTKVRTIVDFGFVMAIDLALLMQLDPGTIYVLGDPHDRTGASCSRRWASHKRRRMFLRRIGDRGVSPKMHGKCACFQDRHADWCLIYDRVHGQAGLPSSGSVISQSVIFYRFHPDC